MKQVRRSNEEGDGFNIAVVGATGAVGEVLFRILEQRRFPVAELRPLASARSVGTKLRFSGREVIVEEARPEAFDGIDIVFFAATGALSKELAPQAVARGAVVIDKSSTWRMHDDVPLVVPEINAQALDDHRGIVSCPNCTTIGAVMALEPIRREFGLRSVAVTTLQAVSGSGREGLDELSEQLAARHSPRSPGPQVFAAPIADNVVPLCGEFLDSGFSSEEMKLVDESRKILGQPDLGIDVTCVRVPVPVGHSASMLVETEAPADPRAARAALDRFPGVRVVDSVAEGRFPTPRDVEGSDEVLVGRVRTSLEGERLWMWQVSDNLRKGAATNAVQIAEALMDRKAIRRLA
jgi:aspartate-semialdehyde dehydrogenase